MVAFLKRVFGAVGKIHDSAPSEIRIGDSRILVSSTDFRKSMPACFYVYVADADAVYARALAAGARSLEEPQEMPYGDRRCMVRDPWRKFCILEYLNGF
jgi:uncharacterized glyoxalase superfamily protein PhnB